MKTREIAKVYGLDPVDFDRWLKQSGHQYRSGITGLAIEDGSMAIEGIVDEFNRALEQERDRLLEEQELLVRQQEADYRSAQEKQRVLASILITSGFNFDGYAITRYSGYISGDDAMSMDRPVHGWFGGVNGDVGTELLASLGQMRRNALAELKESAYALGCNAVIGVDFDYITLDPETATNAGGTLYLPFLFAVTANGNAVVIESGSRS